jgi:hypothetical protein
MHRRLFRKRTAPQRRHGLCEGYGGPAQPSPTIGQCSTAVWAGSLVEVQVVQEARKRSTSADDQTYGCARNRAAPYKWVHPDEER